MSEVPDEGAPPERRTLRWLLGAQIGLAAALIVLDLAPSIPRLISPSTAPELTQPTRPGDQTRQYRPRRPSSPVPGLDPDMPRRLLAEAMEVDGRAGLRLRGGIAVGDGARIVEILEMNAPEIVLLDSQGGSVSDALEIGRAIRGLGSETRLAAGTVCLSACPYIFVGGAPRQVDAEARLGVHQHSFGENTILPAFLAVEDVQRGQAEVVAHLEEMGVGLGIMGPALATPADEIYILTPEELERWRVVTE